MAGERAAGPEACPSLSSLLHRGVQRLLDLQYPADGEAHLRGEFPMRFEGPVSRLDHNYLSGYTLLHLAAASRAGGLPGPVRAGLSRLLDTARDLPGRYQSTAGFGNWYSGRGSGLRAPLGYPWPGPTLCLHDDYDDTAISAILSTVVPVELAVPISAATFAAAPYDPDRDALVPNSVLRLEMAREAVPEQMSGGAGVYQSWVLGGPRPEPDPRYRYLPDENSLELSTVANVFTAAHRLGVGPHDPAQVASRWFVNGLSTAAVRKLLDGDASILDLASTYYPRFPFAPLAFVVHDHVFTDGALLDPPTAALVARAVTEVDPEASWRMPGFGTAAFWLNCAAWSVRGGLVPAEDVAPKIERVWQLLHGTDLLGRDGLWPDLVFFHGAHVGDYRGRAYALALMVETLALLHELGFG